jgi:hypothetical protein
MPRERSEYFNFSGSNFLKRVVSLALVCYKHAGTSEIVYLTILSMYGGSTIEIETRHLFPTFP